VPDGDPGRGDPAGGEVVDQQRFGDQAQVRLCSDTAFLAGIVVGLTYFFVLGVTQR
jgi:hypothetical protein